MWMIALLKIIAFMKIINFEPIDAEIARLGSGKDLNPMS